MAAAAESTGRGKKKLSVRDMRLALIDRYLGDYVIPAETFIAVPVYYERFEASDGEHEFCIPTAFKGGAGLQASFLVLRCMFSEHDKF